MMSRLATAFQIGTASVWKPLSQCMSSGNVTIPHSDGTCQYVFVSAQDNGNVGTIDIGKGGRLVFLDESINMTVSTIVVAGGSLQGIPPGQLVIGTTDYPIQQFTITLTFTGARPPTDPNTPGKVEDEDVLRQKGIIVETDGEIVMHGAKGMAQEEPTIPRRPSVCRRALVGSAHVRAPSFAFVEDPSGS